MLNSSQVLCRGTGHHKKPSSAERPLVKRPEGTTYKTIISIDGGALRVLVATVVVIEVEQSIKRYILENPDYLPAGFTVTSIDDVDINLADYFDCITGASAGAWVTSIWLLEVTKEHPDPC